MLPADCLPSHSNASAIAVVVPSQLVTVDWSQFDLRLRGGNLGGGREIFAACRVMTGRQKGHSQAESIIHSTLLTGKLILMRIRCKISIANQISISHRKNRKLDPESECGALFLIIESVESGISQQNDQELKPYNAMAILLLVFFVSRSFWLRNCGILDVLL